MKPIVTFFTLIFAWAGYSQVSNHATDRYVFDDAIELAALSDEYSKQKAIAEDPARIAASTNRRDAVAKKKAIDEINNAKAIIDYDIKTTEHILSYYFVDCTEVSDFNDDYGFDLPEDITPKKIVNMAERFDYDLGQRELGAPSSTIAIDAIATFLADRFKKEINIAFLDKFRKQLDSLPQLGNFFPLSKKILSESDPYNYPVFMGTLRQACEQDLANLRVNLPQILAALDTNNDKLDVVVNALATLMDVQNFTDLRTALNGIAQNKEMAAKFPKLHKQLGLLAFSLNASTTNTGEDTLFLTGDEFDQFKNSEFRRFYFALLVRQNEGYLDNAGIVNEWNNASQDQVLQNVVSFLKAFGSLNSEIVVLQDSLATGSPERISKSFLVFLTTIDKALIIAEENKWFGQAVNFGDARKVITYAGTFNQAVIYVGAKQYGLALSEITGFVLEVTDAKLTEGQKTMIKKYSGFIADMLNAEGKDELVAALDNSANPVGSYRVKRNSTFNVSLNGYAGVFYGSDMKGTALYGLTAPVGIYAGWGNIWKTKPVLANDDGNSFGLFVPLIDVGAVASFRLQDSETDLADVSWDNVFAPGAYLTYGFEKCPVSLSIGGQMGPALKSVAPDGTSVLGEKEWFWRAGIVIDIPIIDFYTKQKEYKTEKNHPPVPETKVLLPGDDKAFIIDEKCTPKLEGSDLKDIQKLFERFRDSPLFDWSDPNNCEDRAEAVCKILTQYGFANGKAWLFRENPNDLKEKNRFRQSWAFHVAAYLVDESGKEHIIDPALFRDNPGDIQQWAHKVVEGGKAHYVLTKNKYYMHKKGEKFCGDDNYWQIADDISDEHSTVINGLAGPKWFVNSGSKRKAAFKAYKALRDDITLVYTQKT